MPTKTKKNARKKQKWPRYQLSWGIGVLEYKSEKEGVWRVGLRGEATTEQCLSSFSQGLANSYRREISKPLARRLIALAKKKSKS